MPHGRTVGKGARKLGFKHDEGAWHDIPDDVLRAWRRLSDRFELLAGKHGVLQQTNNVNHLGTLGIGTCFIESAKADMDHLLGQLPDAELACLTEGTEHFDAYVEALEWAQDYAHINRQVMLQRVLAALREVLRKPFKDKHDAVLDESPAADKSIDAVMAAQRDLVEIVHTLRQVLCVKG